MKRCMYCGHENDDANETCVKCGNRLLKTPAPGDVSIEEVPDDGMEEMANASVEDIHIAEEDRLGEALREDISAGAQEAAAQTEGFIPEDKTPRTEDIYPGTEYQNSETDVHRGQTYAAHQQYAEEPYGQQPYGGQNYGYEAQADAQQQYGGQAYGYESQPQQYGEVPPAYGYGMDQGRDFSQMNAELMKKARRRVKSPLSFLCALLFTIATISQILNVALGNALTNLSTVSHTITKMFGQNVAVNFMNSLVQMINGVNRWYLIGGGLAACIPSVLLMFGLWMAFSGTSNKRAELSTGGYTMSKTAIILKFIGVCAVLLAAIVFSVAFVVSAGAASSMMSLIAGAIVLLLIILITVFAILYYVQVIYSIRVIRTNAKTGTDIGVIPGFAIFIGILGCAFTVVCMLPMAPDDYIGLAAKGSYAAWLLFISLWALIYRLTVKVKP